MEDRLQKILSAAGICSRRRAEEYITAGRVTVNGRLAALGEKADPARDRIALDGKPVGGPPQACRVLMLYKPRGVVTTLSDEKGRPTVAGLVRGCGGRVWPVGRLDMDSEGLLLLTDDGALTHRLLHPRHQVEKEYLVWVTGFRPGVTEELRRPMTLDGSGPGRTLGDHPRGKEPAGAPDVRPMRAGRHPAQTHPGGGSAPGPDPETRPVAAPDGGRTSIAGGGKFSARIGIFSCKMLEGAL